MRLIDRGRTEPCNSTLGGVKNVFLFKFTPYTIAQIRGVRGSSLTSYPNTRIYKFETLSDANNYEDSLNSDGGYDQKLSVTLKKIDTESNVDFSGYQNIELGVIVEDYNGLFRLMGAFNGVELSDLNATIGGSGSDFNGYKLEFVANERFKAPLFTSLADVGFNFDDNTFFLTTEALDILTDAANNGLIYD
jgi:hypothetical protein